MDIQKEREAFEELPLAKLAIECGYVYYHKETNSYFPNEDYCPDFAPESMNFAWEAWQQAQKVAVPEGFVLVESKHLEALARLGGDMIKNAKYYQDECHIRGFGNSVNFIHKAMIKAVENKK